ncbi:GTP-binding protein Rit2-like [Mytilus californianus]|uniref:GTP-binding protein Rit2-like n=1 Tax=Mytilus californianus TaxID=6549 RepID=UPI002247F99E|nr:GTP-binding protein Rit2-like [Mytilus californianus]
MKNIVFEDKLDPKSLFVSVDGFLSPIQTKSAPSSPLTIRKYSKVNILKEDERRRNSLPISTEKIFPDPYTDRKTKQCKRIRSFKTTSKGVPKATEGDRRESNVSVTSLRDFNRQRKSSDTSEDSSLCCGCSSTSSSGYYRVCVMGADAVGKRTLTTQFMSSDFMCSHIFEIGDVEDNLLTVVIDNEESTLEFVDFSEDKAQEQQVDAYIVVFSVHEKSTYEVAVQYIQYIRNDMDSDRPIIIVANKVDLVRKRQISNEDARKLATKYNCKYIETSATLNVKVDELLVGILKQIKLRLNPDIEKPKVVSSRRDSLLKGSIDMLGKLFHLKHKSKSSFDDVLM